MPTVEDYASLGPFTLDELVDATNSILREKPSLAIQARTVRYYISFGLLPPPSGGPKHARYGSEHLRRLVSIRRWIDGGLSLEQAAQRIALGEHGGESHTVQRRSNLEVREARHEFRASDLPKSWPMVHRIPLTSHSVIEIDANAEIEVELKKAADALKTVLKTFNRTS